MAEYRKEDVNSSERHPLFEVKILPEMLMRCRAGCIGNIRI